ncbi:diacylglycerol/lipid kinase family protein [Nocardioides marmoribigeumensis]|uniref:YegS/Rv2252/BmrU family lipid kinase n=1 Tax=Nocardioides marmoribigeumensis TaxID=433649 RepID=A0ABU2BVL6_9ACTN|nr:diacylglycerol kinase family protein [Nocardioides marmoribigeumensis]MDR7362670.1 YegS/Rv2252/BmrU family lipid kinase [Nocardioides marmoribigeumensis]
MEGLLLISNAGAGTNEDDAVAEAVEVLREKYDVEQVATEDEDELEDVLKKSGDRVVAVAGGDGSLHAVVNALWRLRRLEKTRLGLIPLGTGNDFARGAGIPLEPADAARVVNAGDSVAIDLVVDDCDRVIVNNAHLGIGADASRSALKWKPRMGKVGLGRLGYAIGALSAGLRPDFIYAKVTIDGKLIDRPHRLAQVAIGNGPDVGGGTELIPGADPTSGRITVIVSRAVGPWSRLGYMLRLRGGSHHLMKEVEQLQGSKVEVEGDEFYLSADGEVTGPHTHMSWELRPDAVRMFLPGRGLAAESEPGAEASEA